MKRYVSQTHRGADQAASSVLVEAPELGGSDASATKSARSSLIQLPALSVCVAMATYHRLDRLPLVLTGLVAQAAGLGCDAFVLVVDNDPDASARQVVDCWAARGVRYVHEPAPGIAAARNRAIDEAGSADALVFIDDDEYPSDGWLRALVDAWLSWGCAAVAGPVKSVFESEPSQWVLASGAFSTVLRPNGQVLAGAATNNLLLDLKALKSAGLRFDGAFGLSGGSDTMLTHLMVDYGMQIRWCTDATVTEDVPAHRATKRWVLRRTVRTSNDWSRVALKLSASASARRRERADLTARSLVRAARGAARVVTGALLHRIDIRAVGECELASSWGLILGVLGAERIEYGRPKTVSREAPGRGRSRGSRSRERAIRAEENSQ